MNLASQSPLMVSAEVHPEVIIRMVGSATNLGQGVGGWGKPLEHTRVTLVRVLQLFPQPLTCVQRVREERNEKNCRRSLRGTVPDVCALPK